MPTISLTNNTSVILAASSNDSNATLNRYLRNPLTFVTPAGLNALTGQTMKDLPTGAFPFTLSATAEGAFAVNQNMLTVDASVSATVGLIKGADIADFFDSLSWTPVPAMEGIVWFALNGSLSGGLSGSAGDFSLGATVGSSLALTSYAMGAQTDTFGNTLEQAIKAITIPHDVDDLKSLPVNTICSVEGNTSLQFTASMSFSIFNNPLASASIAALPALSLNAKVGATVEATATHKSGHTVTIAKLPSGLIHLGVELTKVDDLEASLSASAGVTGKVGKFDAVAFLLKQLSKTSTQQLADLKGTLTDAQYNRLNGDIKAAIDATLASSLQVALKVAFDKKTTNSRIFLYEINLNALDGQSRAALEGALRGDFTVLSRAGAALAGIKELASALTVVNKVKHSMVIHLLGIFNAGSINTFIEKSSVNYVAGTSEIVLSDESIDIAENSLTTEQLRHLVVKCATLTIPAAANTPEAAFPLRLIYVDRQADTHPAVMRQFVNLLNATGSPGAAAGAALLTRKLRNYGTCSLSLSLNLTPGQCRSLFIDGQGKPTDWVAYLGFACRAQASILASDGDDIDSDRVLLFKAAPAFWKNLRDAGALENQTKVLRDLGVRNANLNAVAVDATTLIWWSSAMEAYSRALVSDKSLLAVGKDVVKDSNRGFDEPWMMLATWQMLGEPELEVIFTSSLLVAKAAGQ